MLQAGLKQLWAGPAVEGVLAGLGELCVGCGGCTTTETPVSIELIELTVLRELVDGRGLRSGFGSECREPVDGRGVRPAGRDRREKSREKFIGLFEGDS